MKREIADLGLIFIGLMWGLGFIATKSGLENGVGPIYMLALRFSISAIILLILFNKKVRTITKKDIRKMLLISCALFLAYTLQTVGSKYTTASNAAFYTGLNVIFVPYVSWMLNRKAPDIYTYISTILCFLGISIISYDKSSSLFTFNLGDALVILSSLFFGIHVALTGYCSKKYSVEKMMLIQYSIVAIVFFIISFVFNILNINSDGVRILSISGLIPVLYLGIVTTCLCLYLQALFQRYTTSVRAAIFLSTESLFAPIFAYLLLHEHLKVNIYIGGAFIIFAIILSETKLGIKYFKNKTKML